MANTPLLEIPIMEAAQAQKHVTHNAGMQRIEDTLGRAYGEFGSFLQPFCVEEELVGLSGATVTSTIAFPNQCIILGAALRVTDAITGATSFDCGDGSSASRFGGSLGIALGSTNQGTVGPAGNYASTNVVLTANGGNFTGGSVRVALAYLFIQPPTS